MARKKSTIRRSKRQTSNFRISTKPPSRRLRVKSSQLVIPNKFRTSGIIQQLPNITPFPLFSSGDTTADQSRKNLDILQQMAQYQTKALTRKQEVEKSLSKFQKTIKEQELATKLKNLHIPINLNEISDPLERERYEKLKKLKKILTDSQTANERKLYMMRLNNPQISSDGEDLNKPGKLIEPDFSAFETEQSSRIKVNPIFPTVETPQYDTSALDSEYQAREQERQLIKQQIQIAYLKPILGGYISTFPCVRYIVYCILALEKQDTLTADIINDPINFSTLDELESFVERLCKIPNPAAQQKWVESVNNFYLSLVDTLVWMIGNIYATPDILMECQTQLEKINPTSQNISSLQKILKQTLARIDGTEMGVEPESEQETGPGQKQETLPEPEPEQPPVVQKPSTANQINPIVTMLELKQNRISNKQNNYFAYFDELARFIQALKHVQSVEEILLLDTASLKNVYPDGEAELSEIYTSMDPYIFRDKKQTVPDSTGRLYRYVIAPLLLDKLIAYYGDVIPQISLEKLVYDVWPQLQATIYSNQGTKNWGAIRRNDDTQRKIADSLIDALHFYLVSRLGRKQTNNPNSSSQTTEEHTGSGMFMEEFTAPRLYQMIKPARPMFMKAPAPDTQLNNQNEEYEKRKNFFKSRYELMYGKTPSREKIETAMPRRAEPLMLEHPIVTDDKQVLAPNFFRLPFYKTSLKTL